MSNSNNYFMKAMVIGGGSILSATYFVFAGVAILSIALKGSVPTEYTLGLIKMSGLDMHTFSIVIGPLFCFIGVASLYPLYLVAQGKLPKIEINEQA
jgi:hypothetical protein